MKDNSTQTSALEQRITSQKKQSFNLNTWIFENLDIQGNEEVLELCCGTGAQTNIFSQKLLYGSIVSVDINNESIEKAKNYIKVTKFEDINRGIAAADYASLAGMLVATVRWGASSIENNSTSFALDILQEALTQKEKVDNVVERYNRRFNH